MSRTVIVKATLNFGDDRRVAKRTYFKQIPLLWTGFRLISIRLAKNEAYFPTNRTQLSSVFLFHACAQATILTWTWTFFGESISIFLSRSSFFLCLSPLLAVLLPVLSSFFCMELWLAKLLGKGQI